MAPLILAPAATDIDWEILTGCDTFTIHVPVLDANDSAVVVTGWAARAEVKRGPGDPVLFTWSTAAGNASCAGSEVVLNVVSTVTALWAWTDAQVAVIVTDLGGADHCIARGRIRATPTA